MISPRGCCGGGTITLHKILVRMSAVTHSGPLNRAAYVRVSPSIRCRREGLGVLSQMASEEHLGEVRRLRVNRVAADVRRRCTAREGWHARLACNPRQRRSARHRRERSSPRRAGYTRHKIARCCRPARSRPPHRRRSPPGCRSVRGFRVGRPGRAPAIVSLFPHRNKPRPIDICGRRHADCGRVHSQASNLDG